MSATSSAGGTVTARVNGEQREIPRGISVKELIESFDLTPALVVVELNGEIVSRQEYGDTPVGEGDRVELVHFVGGG